MDANGSKNEAGRSPTGGAAGIPRFSLLASLADILHDHQLNRSFLMRLAQRVDAEIARSDRIEFELITLIKSLGGRETAPPPPPPIGPFAYHLAVSQPDPDGPATISIDGGRPFHLARLLAKLLQYLATGGKAPSGRDPLVGWRSRIEIIAYLEKDAHERITKHYLAQMVYLLKEALEVNGYPRELVQSSRKSGVRLAYLSRGHEPPHPEGRTPTPLAPDLIRERRASQGLASQPKASGPMPKQRPAASTLRRIRSTTPF